MKRVLQITGGLGRGGLETFVMNVLRSLPEDSVKFDFAVHSPGMAYEKEAFERGARIFYLPKRRNGFINHWKAWDTFFKEHASEYIAVHMHISSLSLIEPLFFAKKYGLKVRVLHSHNSSASGSKFHNVLHYFNKLFAHSLATDYLGCSDKAIDWFYKWTSVHNKAMLIKNGIDVGKYLYNPIVRDNIRTELCVNKNDVVVGHVGRFARAKNHAFLLDVFYELKKIRGNSKLLLIGVGNLMDETKTKANKLGIIDDVIFTGGRSDVNELLMAMDVFVMPSIYEGLPVSLVEAQASGLPVVCSDTISHDSKITNRLQFLPLDAGANKWAKVISESVPAPDRDMVSSEITQAGFDIRETTKILLDIYSRGNK